MARRTRSEWLSAQLSRRRRAANRSQALFPHSRRLQLEPLEDRRLLAVVTVNTLGDTVNFNDGVTSLREAIFAANTVPGADTINFAASLTSGGPAAILLTQGELAVTDSIAIIGPGANLLTIDAQQASRIINFTAPSGDFAISGLRLTNGRSVGGDVSFSGGAIRSITTGAFEISNCVVDNNHVDGDRVDGGGIFSQNSLTVADCIVSGNTAGGLDGDGGGIRTYGVMTLTRCTATNNSTAGRNAEGGGLSAFNGANISDSIITGNQTTGPSGSGGGGLFVRYGTLVMTGTTVADNATSGNYCHGGGMFVRFGNATITGCTVSGNRTTGFAAYGGGIASETGVITLASSTISENSASAAGGAIATSGPYISAVNCTITNNEAVVDAGGIYLEGDVALRGSIVAQNSRGISDEASDVLGSVSLAFSLLGVNTGAFVTDNGGNLIGTAAAPIDPLLGPLADNGGPTHTHALLAGSPAINRGDLTAVAGVGGVPQFDQRDTPFGRVFNGRIDMGAFEYQTASDLNLVVDTLVDESDGNYALGDLSLREAILLANSYPSIDTISFAPSLTAGGPATIKLTRGELRITDNTILVGPGANILTVDAIGNDPTPGVYDGRGTHVLVFDDGAIGSLKTSSISGLTLTGADSRTAGGAILSRENLTVADSIITGNATRSGFIGGGGGIYSGIVNPNVPHNALTVRNSSITNNAALYAEGGGIRMPYGTLVVEGSKISGNYAYYSGGGISAAGAGSQVTISGSTISDNFAVGTGLFDSGGGLFFFQASAEITDSTISGNTAFLHGGGILSYYGNLKVANSTVSGNLALGDGGGIAVIGGNRGPGQLDAIGSTITGNSAGVGASGIYLSPSIAHAVLSHTIVALNTIQSTHASSDVAGAVTAKFSLLGVNTGAAITDNGGNLIGTPAAPINPLLAPLADNGGPTFTHALLPGSPAINRGDLTAVAGVGGVPQFDQRGTPFGRVFGGRIDIGAFEYQGASDLNLVVDTLADESDGNYALGDLSLREAILLANLYPSTDTIRFAPALSGGTILLTMGELKITDSTSIIGLGADLLTIDASGNDPTPGSTLDDGIATNDGDGSRIFNIDAGTATRQTVSISGLTLTGGDVGIGYGGAISSREALIVHSSTISGNSVNNGNGGGIFITAKLTVTASTISGNSARSPIGFSRGHGGGIEISFSNEVLITGSTISGNVASRGGGGIDITGVNGGSSPDVVIDDSTISGNSAAVGGGIWGISRMAITNSTISGNSATKNSAIGYLRGNGNGGGIYQRSGNLTVTASTISGNSAANGGGIYNRYSNLTVTASTISGNSALSDGGGIFGGALVTDSTISGNSAIGNGGGIASRYSTLTVVNTTISGNKASSGGGVQLVGLTRIGFPPSVFTFQHSTIVANFVNSPLGTGGGVFLAAGTLVLDHTIVATNFAAAGPDIGRLFDTTINPRFSLIGSNGGNGLGAALGGNGDANGNLIGTATIFISPGIGPLADNAGPTKTHALLPDSPAIDRGDPNAEADAGSVPEFDQRGAPFTRVFGGRIDMGAFEAQPIPPALFGDFNADGFVDAADYSVYEDTFGSTTDLRADANGNGVIDAADKVIWKSRFGQSVPAQSGSGGEALRLAKSENFAPASVSNTVTTSARSAATFGSTEVLPAILSTPRQEIATASAKSLFRPASVARRASDQVLAAWLATESPPKPTAAGVASSRKTIAESAADDEQGFSCHAMDEALQQLLEPTC